VLFFFFFFLLIANISGQSVSLFENLSNNRLSLKFPFMQNTENNLFSDISFSFGSQGAKINKSKPGPCGVAICREIMTNGWVYFYNENSNFKIHKIFQC